MTFLESNSSSNLHPYIPDCRFAKESFKGPSVTRMDNHLGDVLSGTKYSVPISQSNSNSQGSYLPENPLNYHVEEPLVPSRGDLIDKTMSSQIRLLHKYNSRTFTLSSSSYLGHPFTSTTPSTPTTPTVPFVSRPPSILLPSSPHEQDYTESCATIDSMLTPTDDQPPSLPMAPDSPDEDWSFLNSKPSIIRRPWTASPQSTWPNMLSYNPFFPQDETQIDELYSSALSDCPTEVLSSPSLTSTASSFTDVDTRDSLSSIYLCSTMSSCSNLTAATEYSKNSTSSQTDKHEVVFDGLFSTTRRQCVVAKRDSKDTITNKINGDTNIGSIIHSHGRHQEIHGYEKPSSEIRSKYHKNFAEVAVRNTKSRHSNSIKRALLRGGHIQDKLCRSNSVSSVSCFDGEDTVQTVFQLQLDFESYFKDEENENTASAKSKSSSKEKSIKKKLKTLFLKSNAGITQ